jgi:hypothetical protein
MATLQVYSSGNGVIGDDLMKEKDSYRISRRATCPYYISHTTNYIRCEGMRVSRQEYNLKTDCCEQYKSCPQYKFLTYHYLTKEN